DPRCKTARTTQAPPWPNGALGETLDDHLGLQTFPRTRIVAATRRPGTVLAASLVRCRRAFQYPQTCLRTFCARDRRGDECSGPRRRRGTTRCSDIARKAWPESRSTTKADRSAPGRLAPASLRDQHILCQAFQTRSHTPAKQSSKKTQRHGLVVRRGHS